MSTDPLIRNKLKRAATRIPYLMRAIRLVWRSTPLYTLAWGVLIVVQGLLPVATVYLTRALVDALVLALQQRGNWDVMLPALLLVGAMAALMLAADALRSVAAWIRTGQSELFQDHIWGLIHEKALAADVAFYESPEFQDMLHRVRSEGTHRPLSLMENLGSLLQNGLTMAAMAAVLLQFSLWVPVALILATLPALMTLFRYGRLHHALWLETTADERRVWYYHWLLTSRENASELRVYHLGEHFRAAFRTVRERLRSRRLELARNRALAELATRTLSLLATGFTMAWMVWRALLGAFTLGDLALFYQAFNQGKQMMGSLLENVGQIYSNSLFLESLFEFLAIEPVVRDPERAVRMPERLSQGICFERVWFCYPGSDRPTLCDFSLTLHAGQITAMVGTNGAGKSTLVKLLCRFYDPTGGVIRVDGQDLRCFTVSDLQQRITALFQEPARYQASVWENIAAGNLQGRHNREEIRTAAQAANADSFIERLPQGFDTLPGKWFPSGTELSVGQWQRLALARAFLRRAHGADHHPPLHHRHAGRYHSCHGRGADNGIGESSETARTGRALCGIVAETGRGSWSTVPTYGKPSALNFAPGLRFP
jgi:ATP-binding cassette, subfamily B, bacterial